MACGVDEVSDERPGRAVPETNQALGWGDCPDPKRAKTQSDLPVCTARHAATRGVIKQESAEVIVGSQELKDRTSQPHGGAEQTSACPRSPVSLAVLARMSRNWKATPAALRALSNRPRIASMLKGRPLSSWIRKALSHSRLRAWMRATTSGLYWRQAPSPPVHCRRRRGSGTSADWPGPWVAVLVEARQHADGFAVLHVEQ